VADNNIMIITPTKTIHLTHKQIQIGEMIEAAIRLDCGALVTFAGTVREITGTHRTLALTYEAYEPMAKSKLETLSQEAISRWSLGAVSIAHRLGICLPGETAVAVITVAPHRSEAFAACAWLMEEIKRVIPIWKENTNSDGITNWVHPGSNEMGVNS
jgi:molybdopterin synthase catalytic subunit